MEKSTTTTTTPPPPPSQAQEARASGEGPQPQLHPEILRGGTREKHRGVWFRWKTHALVVRARRLAATPGFKVASGVLGWVVGYNALAYYFYGAEHPRTMFNWHLMNWRGTLPPELAEKARVMHAYEEQHWMEVFGNLPATTLGTHTADMGVNLHMPNDEDLRRRWRGFWERFWQAREKKEATAEEEGSTTNDDKA